MYLNEQQFKKLLIEMVSISDHPQKDDIIALLKITTVRFEKTAQFARRSVWNQCCEYIYLSIIPDKLVQLKSYSKYLEELCYEIYPVNDEYALVNIFFKPGALS